MYFAGIHINILYSLFFQKIEEYLGNVESYIVSEGQRRFGVEYVDEWLKRLEKASSSVQICEKEEKSRFVLGVPREQKWIRVKSLAKISVEKLKKLTKEFNLSHDLQKDGFLLVYGKGKNLKAFIKKIAAKNKE